MVAWSACPFATIAPSLIVKVSAGPLIFHPVKSLPVSSW